MLAPYIWLNCGQQTQARFGPLTLLVLRADEISLCFAPLKLQRLSAWSCILPANDSPA